MGKKEPTLRERALFLISPKRGNEAYRKRMAELQAGRDAPTRMAATGYGNHGASTTLNSMIGWIAGGGSAEDDIDLQGALLRQRARPVCGRRPCAQRACDADDQCCGLGHPAQAQN